MKWRLWDLWLPYWLWNPQFTLKWKHTRRLKPEYMGDCPWSFWNSYSALTTNRYHSFKSNANINMLHLFELFTLYFMSQGASMNVLPWLSFNWLARLSSADVRSLQSEACRSISLMRDEWHSKASVVCSKVEIISSTCSWNWLRFTSYEEENKIHLSLLSLSWKRNHTHRDCKVKLRTKHHFQVSKFTENYN